MVKTNFVPSFSFLTNALTFLLRIFFLKRSFKDVKLPKENWPVPCVTVGTLLCWLFAKHGPLDVPKKYNFGLICPGNRLPELFGLVLISGKLQTGSLVFFFFLTEQASTWGRLRRHNFKIQESRIVNETI